MTRTESKGILETLFGLETTPRTRNFATRGSKVEKEDSGNASSGKKSAHGAKKTPKAASTSSTRGRKSTASKKSSKK